MSTNQQLLDSIKNTLKSILAPATKTKSGLLSANDKEKLDTIARSANNYTHPDSTVSAGTYTKVTVDIKGHITEGSNPTTLAGYGIIDAATSEQGNKADSAIQSITIGGVATTKTNGVVDIPAYPTTLPANNTVHTYSKTSTSPISGKGVYAALCTLDKTLTAAEGYAISSITQTDGLLSEYTQIHIPTKISELENDLSFSDTSGTVTSITLTADSPIKIDNTAAITGSGTRKISHNNSGVTAGDYGDTTNQTPGFGATFKVPSISVNATGHVTKVTTHTVKIPNHMYHSLRDDLKFEYERDSSNNITATYITHANDTISAGTVGDTGNERTLAFGGTFKVPYVEYDKKGHIVSASTISLKLPSNPNVNTTYSFAGGTNKFTVTPSTGSPYDVTITPSINLASQVTGILPIANGGTGASDAATARTNLGITPANIGAATSGHTHSNLAFKANGSAVFTYNGSAAKTLNIIPGTGLGISSTTAGNITINHSNSITEGTISGDASKTLAFGGTFKIPSISYDEQGHIKSVTTTTMTMPANPNTDTKVLQTAVTSADYTLWRSLIFGNSSGVEGFSPATTTSGVFVVNTITCQPSTGTVRAYTLKSPVTTSTHLAGNKGTTIINSTASAGSYTMLAKLNSTNGYFTDGVHLNKRVFNYTAKSTVDDGTNSVTKSLTLLDESGNSSFPGTITANAGIVNNNFNVKDLTVTGSTTIGSVLTMNDSKYTRNVLCLYDDEDDHNYGSELCIEGAGNLFVGGGESANSLRKAFKSGLLDGDSYTVSGEGLYLSSDWNIYLYSNIQTPADRRGIVYDGSGILRPLVTNTRQLGSSSFYWNKAYITEIYGTLKGNATSADKVNNPLTVSLNGSEIVYDGSRNKKVEIRVGNGLGCSYMQAVLTGGEVIDASLEIFHSDCIIAGTASGSATKPLTFGDTFNIPTITYNAQGHITGTGVTTMTMPTKLPNSLTIKTNGTSAAVFDGSLAKSVNITPASIGAAVDNRLTNQDLNTVTAPGFYNAAGGNTVANKPSGISNFGLIVIHRASGAYYTQIIFDPTSSYRRFCENGTWGEWKKDELTDTVTTVTTSGSGNAVTAITASNGALTVTKGTFLTAHPTISKSTNTTSTAYPAVGGSFTVIDSVTQDTNGHITKVNTKTVTLPPVYATCATARATVDKVATLANFTLNIGARVLVKFTDTGTADPASGTLTLNVNNTGAKQIKYLNTGYIKTPSMGLCNRLSNNYTQCFTYDGTYWIIELYGDANTAVTNTLNTTTKAYITGTTSATTNTGGQIFDTGVYLDTTAGRLTATSFKENGSLLQDKYKIWRKALVGQNANCTTNPYYKFASISLSATNDDQSITFKVSTVFGDATTVVGILTAHVRTDSNGYWSTGELVWEYAVSGVNISKFIYAHNASTKPTVVELWACVDVAYRVYHFDVISENSRTSTFNTGYWTLYTTITNTTSGNLAAVTAGYTTFTSKLATLKNSIQGYAAALSTSLAITTSISSGSYLDGNKGVAIINSTAGAGAYTVLAKLNSTNGYFTDGVYQGKRMFYYTAKSTVDAGTNSTTKALTLLDESGNSSFPGSVWMPNGTLYINPGSVSNYTEGIRIHSATNGYTTIALCGTDNTGSNGTSAKTWSIHTFNGGFYISNNGSKVAATQLSCESSVWKVNKNEILHAGNCASYFIFSGNCATASSELAKVVTGIPNFALKVGVTIAVNFTDTGTTFPTSGEFTLNVNDTGAIPMGYSRNGVKTKVVYSAASIFNKSQVHFFTYTGVYWLCTDINIDDMVRHVPNNKTKAYLTGTTNASTNTGNQVFDNAVYLTTTAGQMNATSYKVAEKVTMQYNSTEQCLNFVFS